MCLVCRLAYRARACQSCGGICSGFFIQLAFVIYSREEPLQIDVTKKASHNGSLCRGLLQARAVHSLEDLRDPSCPSAI